MSPLPHPAPSLVEIIELKWLLAGVGVHVHVERLQSDQAYAQRTLQEAANAPHPCLRDKARRLQRRLGLVASS